MKKLLCPQCKIAGMYVKNDQGERLLVYIAQDGTAAPVVLQRVASPQSTGHNGDTGPCCAVLDFGSQRGHAQCTPGQRAAAGQSWSR